MNACRHVPRAPPRFKRWFSMFPRCWPQRRSPHSNQPVSLAKTARPHPFSFIAPTRQARHARPWQSSRMKPGDSENDMATSLKAACQHCLATSSQMESKMASVPWSPIRAWSRRACWMWVPHLRWADKQCHARFRVLPGHSMAAETVMLEAGAHSMIHVQSPPAGCDRLRRLWGALA
jgi:hypothetical protein